MNDILAAVPLLKENSLGMCHFQVLVCERIFFFCYLGGIVTE